MDDWQKGDLALCVRYCPSYPPAVQPGSIHIVEWVWPDSVDAADPTFRGMALDLVGVTRMDGEISYWAGSFRKIRPHEADAEDAETIALLNSQPMPVDA